MKARCISHYGIPTIKSAAPFLKVIRKYINESPDEKINFHQPVEQVGLRKGFNVLESI